MANRALGFAAAADAELAEPAAGLRLQRQRSRRLPDGAGSRRVHRQLRQGDRGPGTDPHHRRVGAPHRGGLSRAHRPGRLAMPDARHRVRGLQHRRHAGLRRPGAALDRDADGAAVSQPRPARRRRRPGGGRVGERHPDRQRNPPFGPSGDAGGRRAHSRAPHVPRQGPGVVDGRRRRARRAL